MLNISLVTTNRSDFGILKNLCIKLQNNRKINFNLIVTGSHFDKKLGSSFKEIKSSKLKISRKIKINIDTDNQINILKYISETIKKFSLYLNKNHIDFIIILGDRFETFAIAQSAYVLSIPIIHIHGGELTYDVLDEGFRHSITKLSSYHFVSTENYRKRVIQLGENPNTVFNVGSLGVENIKLTKFYKKSKLEKLLKLKFLKNNILVAYHPETKNRLESIKNFKILVESIKSLNDTLIIFTYPNNEPGYKKIISIIDKSHKFFTNSVVFKNLGQIYFFNLLKNVDCIVGNSSSGIIEAPSLNTYTLNIGDRQNGRIRAKSVIDSKANKNDIKEKINYILKNSKNKINKNISNPYEKNKTSEVIIKKILKLKTKPKKIFYDL